MKPTEFARRGIYVQYGCGLCAPEGWLNFDASPRLRLERLPGLRTLLRASTGLLFPADVQPGDILHGLPVPDSSAVGVYCSHVLEHLPRDELPTALRNTLRMLMPSGVFRLVVPDLQWRASRYLVSAKRADASAADLFMSSCFLGTRQRLKHPFALLRNHYGNSAHLWMYDFPALKALLEEAGFTGIRRCELGDSGNPMFALVEDKSRFFEDGRRELAIEAARPTDSVNVKGSH